MVEYAGAHNYGSIYSIGTNGTGFKTLLSFSGTAGGEGSPRGLDALRIDLVRDDPERRQS